VARAGLCGGLFIILGALPCAAQQAPPFYFITQGSLVDAFYYNGTAVSFGANGSGSWNESLSLNYGGPGGQVSTNGSSGPASWSGQFSGTMSLTNTVVPLDCSAYGCLSQGPHGSIRGAVQVYVHGPAGNTFHIVHTGGGSVTATYATNLGGEASSAWSSFSVLASSQHPSQTSAVNISQIIDGISTLPTLTYQGQVYSFAASFNTYGGISLGAPIGYPTTGSASFQVNESISANLVRPNQTPPTAVIDPISAASQNVPVTLDGSHSHANTSGASLIDYKWTIQNSSGGTDTLSGSTVQYTWSQAGTYSVSLTVTDSDGLTGSTSSTVTILPSPTLTCPSATTTINVSYSSAFTASGGTPPYTTYTITTGSLPPGLTLNSATGAVTGTPTTVGTYPFTGKVTDSAGQSGTANCNIEIKISPCTISIAPSSREFPQEGGFGAIRVTATDPSCVWTYRKLDMVDWLSCTACDVGFTTQGTGLVEYTVAANTVSGVGRTARIRIEDANHVAVDHTVQQDGAGCGRRSDGCSIPTVALGAAEGFLTALGQFNPTVSGCLDPNNPACGTNTRFSFGGPGGNLACDNHDYCYGTYSGALSGPTYDNWKLYCDSQLRADALAACDAAERAHEPAGIVANCRTMASAYGTGVNAFGDTIVSGYAYSTAQQAAYSCTPWAAPAPDGSLGPSGGVVSDTLFGSQAQVILPQGAVSATTDVTISVLTQSAPTITLPPGFRRLATFPVQFDFNPQLVTQIPATSVTLPLVTRLAVGTTASLFTIDRSTQTLAPVLGPGGLPLTGTVNAGEYSATFNGLTHMSLFVGLLSAAPVPGDVNDDLRVDCVDVRLVQAVFGKRSTDPGYDARADVNHDGIIDIRDLSFVSQHLPAGTRCQ